MWINFEYFALFVKIFSHVLPGIRNDNRGVGGGGGRGGMRWVPAGQGEFFS